MAALGDESRQKSFQARCSSPASDLLLWHQGKSFALELKAPGGRATKSQLQFLAGMEKAGVCTCLGIGLDAALRKLEGWGLLRGRMT